MVEQPDLAWRLLEITALALPALAILVQAMLRITDTRGTDGIESSYLTTTVAAFLIIPLSLTAMISISTILISYDITWLTWALLPMGIAFLFLPLFLYLVWRGQRRLFKQVFLEKEKEAVETAIERDRISAEEGKQEIESIEQQQRGILWHFRNPRNSEVVGRLTRIFAVISVIGALGIIIQPNNLLVTAFGIFVLAYATPQIWRGLD